MRVARRRLECVFVFECEVPLLANFIDKCRVRPPNERTRAVVHRHGLIRSSDSSSPRDIHIDVLVVVDWWETVESVVLVYLTLNSSIRLRATGRIGSES